MICEYTGLEREEMCVFGDRLYTDIAMGKLHGVCSILVLTGETTLEDVEKADEDKRPDYIFDSLAEISEKIFG